MFSVEWTLLDLDERVEGIVNGAASRRFSDLRSAGGSEETLVVSAPERAKPEASGLGSDVEAIPLVDSSSTLSLLVP